MKVNLKGEFVPQRIARAANNNARAMRAILTAMRDLATAGQVDPAKAFRVVG